MGDNNDQNATRVDDSMIRGQQVVLVTSFGPHRGTFQWQRHNVTVCGQEKETGWPISVWYKIENLTLLRPPGLTISLDGVPAKLALWSRGGDECLSPVREFAYPDREFVWSPSDSSDVDAGLDVPRPVYLQISPLDAHGLGVFSITIDSRDTSCPLENRHNETVSAPQLPPINRSNYTTATAPSTVAPTTTLPVTTTTNMPGYESPTARPISTNTIMMMGNNNKTMTTSPTSKESNAANDGNPLSGRQGSIILGSFAFFLVATLVAAGALLWTQRRRHRRLSRRQQQQQQKTHQRDHDNDPSNDPLERSTTPPPPQSFIVLNGLNDERDHYNDEGGETENTLDDADDEYYNNDDDDDEAVGADDDDDDVVVPTPWILFRKNNNNYASGTTFTAGRNRRNRRRPDILPTVDESSMEESSQYSTNSRYSITPAPAATTTTTNSTTTSALDDTTTVTGAATADVTVAEHRPEDDVERCVL